MSQLTPATPGSLSIDELEKTLGVYFVAYMFSMVLYGFTFFQAYMYYSRYPRDPWFVKAVVALLWALDTTVASILSQTLYHYFVTLFPFTISVEFATTPFCVQLQLSILAVFIAQLFYTYTVWSANKNRILCGSIAAISTLSFALSTASSAQLFHTREFAQMALGSHKAFGGVSHALTAVTGLLVFVGLATGTLPKGFNPIQSLFDAVIEYGISYGGLAVLVQLLYTFVFVGVPSRLYWLPFQIVSHKLFILGAITLLNARSPPSSSSSSSSGTGTSSSTNPSFPSTQKDEAWSAAAGLSRTLGAQTTVASGRTVSFGNVVVAGAGAGVGGSKGKGSAGGWDRQDTLGRMEFAPGPEPIVIDVGGRSPSEDTEREGTIVDVLRVESRPGGGGGGGDVHAHGGSR